jgi:O-antigen/teichoic acid export membrane protein
VGKADALLTDSLTGRRLVANSLWNFIGQGAPLVVGVVTIPLLIRELGLARFGLLTIAWALLGYFSIFDLGLGRALTKMVADRAYGIDPGKLRPMIWSALVMMLGIGIGGSVVVLLIASPLVDVVIRPSPSLRHEAITTIFWLGASLPLITVSSGLRGVLEAKQLFGWVAAVKLALGLSTFIGPVLVIPFTVSLDVIVPVLVASRVVTGLVTFALCQSIVPDLWRPDVRPGLFPRLLRDGSWMTVSNVISPLMTYLDRFFIAGLMSLTAVTYYATPYELTTRMTIVPVSVTGVLFPAFASVHRTEPARVAWMFSRAILLMGLVWFCLCLSMIASAGYLITAWLGPEFANHSTLVMQILILAIFLNGIAFIPFALLQASGRPDVTAKLHLAELPFYLIGLIVLVHLAGIVGAAVMALLRMGIDLVLLLYFSGRLTPVGTQLAVRVIFMVMVAAGALSLTLLPAPKPVWIAYAIVLSSMIVLATWKRFWLELHRESLPDSG